MSDAMSCILHARITKKPGKAKRSVATLITQLCTNFDGVEGDGEGNGSGDCDVADKGDDDYVNCDGGASRGLSMAF